MPYRTKNGTHYHMTEGCCGAFIQCDTKGLTPCTKCCGNAGASHGTPQSLGGSSVGASGGSAIGATCHGGDADARHVTMQATEGISPAADIARVMSTAPSASGHVQAPETTVTPDALARSIGGVLAGGSDFSRLPERGSVAELRTRGRVAGMRGDQYVVHVKDYEGSNRTNYTISVSEPTSLRSRPGQFVRIDWEDDYWDKHGYGFVQIDDASSPDGLGGIGDTFSFSDYDARRLAGALRGAGMSDGDFRQTIGDALEGFGVRRTTAGAHSPSPKGRQGKASPRRTRRKSEGRAFADAVNAGDTFLVGLRDSGADVEDDDLLTKAFDDAIRNGSLDVPEHLRGAAWASVLDARERELGWD